MDDRIGTITDKAINWPKKSITGRVEYNRPPIGTVNIGNNRFVVLDVQPTENIRAEIADLRAGLLKSPAANAKQNRKGMPDATD